MPNMSALTFFVTPCVLGAPSTARETPLTRDVRERRPESARRRELRDEHGRLAHDGVDEKAGVHGAGALGSTPSKLSDRPRRDRRQN